MAEFTHPPIITEVVATDFSHEADFAERAYEVLNVYQIDCTEVKGDTQITYPVTGRVDMASSVAGVEFALRLKRLTSFAVPAVVSPGDFLSAEESTSGWIVLELQYGTRDPEEDDEPVTDEDFAWHPYVRSIVNTETKETWVVDPSTGRDLPAFDIFQASLALTAIHDDLRYRLYDAMMPEDRDIPISYLSLRTRYEPLADAEELDLNYHCPTCGSQNSLCFHPDPEDGPNNPRYN